MTEPPSFLINLFKFLLFLSLTKYFRSQECHETQLLPEYSDIAYESKEEILPRNFVLLFEDLSESHTMLGNNYPFVLVDADPSREIIPKSCLVEPSSALCAKDSIRMQSHANLEAYQLALQGADLDISRDLNSQLIQKRKKDKKFEITIRMALEKIFSHDLSPQDFAQLQPYVNLAFGKFLARLPSARTNQPLACAEIASISYMRLLAFQRNNNIKFPIHYVDVNYYGKKRKYDHVFLIVNAESLPKEAQNIQGFNQFDMTDSFVIDPYFGKKLAIEPFDSSEVLNIHRGIYANKINVKLLPSYDELQKHQHLTQNVYALKFFKQYIDLGLQVGQSNFTVTTLSKKTR